MDSGDGKSEDRRDREVPWLAGRKSDGSAEDQGRSARKPKWKPRSRQEEGRKTEKEIAKRIGAKVHPNSGALRIKHDASDAETLYEIKDANKVYTLGAEELYVLWVRAVRETKEPVFIIKYNHRGITATISITREQ